jgi:hypothetical protein
MLKTYAVSAELRISSERLIVTFPQFAEMSTNHFLDIFQGYAAAAGERLST